MSAPDEFLGPVDDWQKIRYKLSCRSLAVRLLRRQRQDRRSILRR